jgi:hypothetical protein
VLTEAATGLEIVVWRPYEPPHQIAFTGSQDGSLEYLREGAQRDIFRWRTREDVWGGIRDAALRQGLRDKLVGGFDPFRPPGDRSISTLTEFVAELKEAITAGSTTWAVSTQASDDREEAEIVNSVMALYNQLSWICKVFRDVPGVFLSVR